MQNIDQSFSPKLQDACTDVIRCKQRIHSMIENLKTYNSLLKSIFSIGFGQMIGEHRTMGSIELFYLTSSPFEVVEYDADENPEPEAPLTEKVKKIDTLIKSELHAINQMNLQEIPTIVKSIKELTDGLNKDKSDILKMRLLIIKPIDSSMNELKIQMKKVTESIELITKIINEKIQQIDNENELIEIFMSMLLDFYAIMGNIPTSTTIQSIDSDDQISQTKTFNAWVEISKQNPMSKEESNTCCLIV